MVRCIPLPTPRGLELPCTCNIRLTPHLGSGGYAHHKGIFNTRQSSEVSVRSPSARKGNFMRDGKKMGWGARDRSAVFRRC